MHDARWGAGEQRAYPTGRQIRQVQPPARALRPAAYVVHGVEIGDEARVGGLMHVHEFGLALDQVPARQVRVAGQDLRVRDLSRTIGLPRWPSTTGTTTWPAGRLLNAPINSVRSLAPISG